MAFKYIIFLYNYFLGTRMCLGQLIICLFFYIKDSKKAYVFHDEIIYCNISVPFNTRLLLLFLLHIQILYLTEITIPVYSGC